MKYIATFARTPTYLVLLVVAFLIGSISCLAFAPYDIWPIAIFTPAILLSILQHPSCRRPKLSGFLPGFCFGLGYYGFGIYWIHISMSTYGGTPFPIAILLMAGFVAFLALFPALCAYLWSKFFNVEGGLVSLFAFATLWTLQEWLKSLVFTGFPWLDISYSQTESALFSLAPLGGSYLVSFASVLLGITLLQVVRRKATPLPQRISAFSCAFTILLVCFVSGKMEWTQAVGKSQSIVLVQGNIPQDLRWLTEERGTTIQRYLEQTQPYWQNDVIIWPEAAIPAFPFEVPTLMEFLGEQTEAFNSVLITGIPTYENEQILNTISLFGPEAKGTYHKYRLVPFGEFLPFQSLLKMLGDIIPFFALPMSSFTAGDKIQPPMMAHGYSVAAALCYEIAFSQQLRDNWQGSDWILTLSNDAWFGDSIGPHQHLQIAQMRAKELGRPVIRSTNNGITAFIDHKGRIAKQAPQFEQTTLSYNLSHYQGTTFFAKYGQYPWILGAFALVGALYWRSRFQRRGYTLNEFS